MIGAKPFRITNGEKFRWMDAGFSNKLEVGRRAFEAGRKDRLLYTKASSAALLWSGYRDPQIGRPIVASRGPTTRGLSGRHRPATA